MKKYKNIIKEGLSERHFELKQIFSDESELPWWIEERWVIKRTFDKLELHILFLTNRGWESGTKTVDEVFLSERLTSSYSDTFSKVSSIDLRKGNLNSKTTDFWKEFDSYLSLR